MFRCTFVLIEHDNLTSNLFVRAIDKETAASGTSEIFKVHLIKCGIPNDKFTQEVQISSDEEVADYEHYMRNRNLTNKELN